MYISAFDIFKIGVGPSSSHTMGPMVAGNRFRDSISNYTKHARGLRATLHGSLAYTGKGHATDRALILGLAGMLPQYYHEERAEQILSSINNNQFIKMDKGIRLEFNPSLHLVFDYKTKLPLHTNGLSICLVDRGEKTLFQEKYYSIGGGFVLTEDEMINPVPLVQEPVPNDFSSVEELLKITEEKQKSIYEIILENEEALRSPEEVHDLIIEIWMVMNHCIEMGVNAKGILPGGLKVKRRAGEIYEDLMKEKRLTNQIPPHTINDWISVYAMAVNEENANNGQVVTAPTNGAAGVIPATLKYYLEHVPNASGDKIPEFLFTAAAIGGIIKSNASISGAECGCQAEVGSAAAMAAAGLCAVLGGTPNQVENASEIALEHHLGMICDPIMGLVQVPCIERNGLGAIKAVSAASLSLRGTGQHIVPLDSCIKTMYQTGLDMNEKYKETSLGGLAVNVPNC